MDLKRQTFRYFGVTAAVVLATVSASGAQMVPPGNQPFGVYDPNGDFIDLSGVSIEHLFLPWEDVLLSSLQDAQDYADARDRTLMVTIEPWTWSRDERNTPRVLREGIESGAYDAKMDNICSALGELDIPVTIRWAQEMDDKSGQFIWASWAPQSYISAYRRRNDVCRKNLPDAKYMRSPLGRENMAEYYPGDNYVDVVGLSVFSDQPWETAILGGVQNFEEIFGPQSERAIQSGKPIMVAELGFVGDARHVEQWNADVRTKGELSPELAAVVYFASRRSTRGQMALACRTGVKPTTCWSDLQPMHQSHRSSGD